MAALTLIRPDLDIWEPGEHNGTTEAELDQGLELLADAVRSVC